MTLWFCPKCVNPIEWCGSRPKEYTEGGRELIQITDLLYCKNCNANIEFTRLSD